VSNFLGEERLTTTTRAGLGQQREPIGEGERWVSEADAAAVPRPSRQLSRGIDHAGDGHLQSVPCATFEERDFARIKEEPFMFFRRRFDPNPVFIARKRRENEAPRLALLAPALESLRMEIHEGADLHRPGSRVTHVRQVVVAAAGAHFFVPCHDPDCEGGGHDATREVLTALEQHLHRFGSKNSCPGRVRRSPCTRVLHYQAAATYRYLALEQAPAARDFKTAL
jgi:hypothetical protein